MKTHAIQFLAALAILALSSCAGTSPTQAGRETGAKQVATKSQDSGDEALKILRGMASWYSVKTNGGTKTASGRPLSNTARTAAHKTLPFGTKVRVTSLFNGNSEILYITDRGPYTKGRVIDLTVGSAKRLGFFERGITKVKVEVLSYGDWKYRKH